MGEPGRVLPCPYASTDRSINPRDAISHTQTMHSTLTSLFNNTRPFEQPTSRKRSFSHTIGTQVQLSESLASPFCSSIITQEMPPIGPAGMPLPIIYSQSNGEIVPPRYIDAQPAIDSKATFATTTNQLPLTVTRLSNSQFTMPRFEQHEEPLTYEELLRKMNDIQQSLYKLVDEVKTSKIQSWHKNRFIANILLAENAMKENIANPPHSRVDRRAQLTNEIADRCFNCLTKNGKQWRTVVVEGVQKVACNACGLRYSRMAKEMSQFAAQAKKSNHPS